MVQCNLQKVCSEFLTTILLCLGLPRGATLGGVQVISDSIRRLTGRVCPALPPRLYGCVEIFNNDKEFDNEITVRVHPALSHKEVNFQGPTQLFLLV